MLQRFGDQSRKESSNNFMRLIAAVLRRQSGFGTNSFIIEVFGGKKSIITSFWGDGAVSKQQVTALDDKNKKVEIVDLYK